jgi:hypothetical protein
MSALAPENLSDKRGKFRIDSVWPVAVITVGLVTTLAWTALLGFWIVSLLTWAI